MRKAIRLFVVLCIVALAATVYQPTKAQSLPEVLKLPDQIAGGRPVTFTITNMPPETDTAARKAWDELVGRFQAKYPNVTVQGLEYTYGADSFAALVAGDQVPTLFQVYMTEPQKYIESGVAGDITSLLDASGLTSVFNSDLLNLASKDGKYYAIPYNAYAMGLGYNISLLKAAGYDAPPATWDELREMAKKLTNRDNGVVGFSFINDGGPATGWHFTVLAYTYGATPGGIIHLADGKYSAGFDDPAMVGALQLIKDLRWTDDVLPRDTLDWGTNATGLATGQAAMVLMAGDQYRWIKTTFRETDMNNIGFAPLPAGPGGIVSLTGGDMYMVSAKATDDQKEAAVYFELWRLLDPAEVQLGLEAQAAEENAAVGGPALPLYVGEYQAAREEFQKTYFNLPYDNYSAFLNAFATGKAHLQTEPVPAGQEYYTSIGAVVSAILTDQSVDPATALKDAGATFQSTTLDTIAVN